MSAFFIVIHVLACLLLILIILIQQGKGGGLVQSLSNVENMFGTKTSAFLTKSTSILAIIFFITCLSLALLSAQKSKSLMKGFSGKTAPSNTTSTAPDQVEKATKDAVKETVPTAAPITETPKEEAAKPDASKTGK